MGTGFFVTFEGGEGAGKSTQIAKLGERLREEGYTVCLTREPGGTLIGEEIRHILKHSDAHHALTAETECLLLNASRAQLVQEVIRPALARGEVVLCDRFYDSTIAYQVCGRGLPFEAVFPLIALAVTGTRPHLTYFLDVSPAVGLANRGKLPDALDRIEQEVEAFHARVYQGFQHIARSEPHRVVTMPYRAGDVQGMHEAIYALFKQRYAQRHL